MKKNLSKLTAVLLIAVLCLALTLTFANAESAYTVSKHFDTSTVSEIPADAVNQVMFAYSESVDVDFTTTLTLNDADMTYVLYKEIATPLYTDEEGNENRTFLGQYEFTGSYTVSESDASTVILAVPSAAKYNCHYPTVLNYQSIEKQTQDWVSSEEAPWVLNRFNNWYPVKAEGCAEQPVTLEGDTMSFAEVEFATEEEAAEAPEEEESSFELAEGGIIGAAAGDKILTLKADGTFEFEYPAYGITETGTWTWENYVLTVTPEGAEEGCVAAFNENYNLALTYQCQKFSMITQDFVIENWGDALGTSGTYTVQ